MTKPVAIDQICVNTIRTLAMDAVQKANSGHPGTPMDAAPTVYCLWQRFLRYDPDAPDWMNRDRFVLSAGHASALLYSFIYLSGVKAISPTYEKPGGPAITMDDLKSFRQAGSRCPGHPEYGWTSGVEATTGPLGQGIANSVGMAIAQRWLGATYNRPGYDLFDYNVFAFCGDGCLMEGISSEAGSVAGHLKLSNLCWIYDNNHISIEGSTAIAFTEDRGERFRAFGWNVVHVTDANDLEMLAAAYQSFLDTKDRPTFIIVDSHIGYGAPHKHDTAEAHGEALGVEEVRLAKEFFGMDPDKDFYVPDGVREHFEAVSGNKGRSLHAAWDEKFAAYREQYPDLATQLDQMRKRELPKDWDSSLPVFPADAKGLATRESSGKVLNAIAEKVPWVIGGAADLAPSTKTHLNFKEAGEFQAPGELGSYSGRNLHFGVREHSMCAISNGMALSKLRAFASSFFVFTDYCRGSIRLSSLMELPLAYVWTHDSISLGEDGPTHEPIEHLASFRAMPGVLVIRPGDANEVVESWRVMMNSKDRPSLLVLTRQAIPTFDRTKYGPASGAARGAYVLADADGGKPDVLLMATGSEVRLCVAAYEQLKTEGIKARVISMPCWELFEEQSAEYRDGVIPPDVSARVAVEEASTFGWERYTGKNGAILGMHRFGLSAPLKVVSEYFGFEPDHVIAAAKEQIKRTTA